MEEDNRLTCGYRRKGNIVLKRDGSLVIDSYIPAYIPNREPRRSGFWKHNVLTENDFNRGKIARAKLHGRKVKTKTQFTPMKLWGKQVVLTKEVPA